MFKPYTLKVTCEKCKAPRSIEIKGLARLSKVGKLCRSCAKREADKHRAKPDYGYEHRELMKLAEYMEKGKYI